MEFDGAKNGTIGMESALVLDHRFTIRTVIDKLTAGKQHSVLQ
jgi:hypothetical protein